MILRSSGSVGLSLLLWLLGAIVAACGTVVYIELGTVSFPFFLGLLLLMHAHILTLLMRFRVQALPYSGGEKNYLDFIFRRPRFLATCTYAAYAVFIVRVPF